MSFNLPSSVFYNSKILATSNVHLITHALALTIFAACIILYLVLVRVYRFQHVDALERKYGSKNGVKRDMPPDEAQHIVESIFLHEFPFSAELAGHLVLFRTFGIPTGTKILNGTSQFSNVINAHRRSVDTVAIISEILFNPFTSNRSKLAFERLNFLHARHNIVQNVNKEGIYLLGLFMYKIAEHIDGWEWRPLRDFEREALFITWKTIGQKMGWQDIRDTREEMKTLAKEIESELMKYSPDNRACSEGTITPMLHYVPGFLKGFAKSALMTLLDDTLISALGYSKPSAALSYLVHSIITTRAFCIRHFFLPRFTNRVIITPNPINPGAPLGQEHYFLNVWRVHPWYVSIAEKYGLGGALCYLFGYENPSVKFNGTKGYCISELGPRGLEHIGPGQDRPSQVEGVLQQRFRK